MNRRLRIRKVWQYLYIIFCLGLVLVGWTRINELQTQKLQLEVKMESKIQEYQKIYADCEDTQNKIIQKEESNTRKEEEIRTIWQLVFNWNSVTLEMANEVGVGGEYKKYILIDMMDDLATSLASTPTNRGKIQKCEDFIEEVRSTIGTTGIAQNAIEYGKYLVRVFSERK